MTLRSDVESYLSILRFRAGPPIGREVDPNERCARDLEKILAAHPDDKQAMWEWCAKGFNFPFYMGPTVWAVDNEDGTDATGDTPEEAVRKAMRAERGNMVNTSKGSK